MDHTGGIGGEIRVMGNHDDGITFGMNTTQFFHNKVGVSTIKVTGRFIGKDDFRGGNEGASNGDALFLTTRELVGIIIFAFLHIEVGKHF